MSFKISPVDLPQFNQLSDDACRYIKKNKTLLIERFAGTTFPSVDNPISIFMAGSPGAGKTEFSRSLIRTLEEGGEKPIVRIDADEIRSLPLPGYNGSNAPVFQRAASLGVDKLHDYVLHKNKNFILDGTFSKLDKACDNIDRSLKRSRIVIVAYVYQDPVVSWKFAKKREALDGRVIPKQAFIDEFLGARNTVTEVQKKFGGSIRVWLRQHNLEKIDEPPQFSAGVSSIDEHITSRYAQSELESLLS